MGVIYSNTAFSHLISRLDKKGNNEAQSSSEINATNLFLNNDGSKQVDTYELENAEAFYNSEEELFTRGLEATYQYQDKIAEGDVFEKLQDFELALYQVVDGDSFSEIAEAYGVPVDEIKALNPQIENINNIEVDDYIRIPNPNTVDVKEGDSLSSIAQSYGLELEELTALNQHIVDINKIDIGDKVILPRGAEKVDPKELTVNHLKETWGKEYSHLMQGENKEFFDKLYDVCQNVGCDSEDLLFLMCIETAGSLKADQKAGGSSGTGLIQFVEDTANDFGTTTKELENMSETEQLDYVEKYLIHRKEHYNNNEDYKNLTQLYLAIFCPGAMDESDDYVLYKKGSNGYGKNSSIDTADGNNNGAIEVSDITARINNRKNSYITWG